MERRAFLKLSAVGGTLATAGALPATSANAYASSTTQQIYLTISPAITEMIDGTQVYTLNFFQGYDNPNPELRVKEGELVTVTVSNQDSQPHMFWIPGVYGAGTGLIQPGQTRTTSFVAPAGGTYMYLDYYKNPLNRLMGLHGAFIVEPEDDGRTPEGSETPYSRADQTPQVQALFDALGDGRDARFPGDKWRARDLRREKVWLVSQIDPSLNERVAFGEDINPATIKQTFLPRYFTINGLSGFDTAIHDQQSYHQGRAGRIMPAGKQGEPCLLRCINVGLANHALHIHGNHCMEMAEGGPQTSHKMKVSSNIYEHDTWLLAPMHRIDMLLPFERPPDVPAGSWPPTEEPFPLRYVMHCHFEISQTAGGGNYPQGLVTHWEMTAPL